MALQLQKQIATEWVHSTLSVSKDVANEILTRLSRIRQNEGKQLLRSILSDQDYAPIDRRDDLMFTMETLEDKLNEQRLLFCSTDYRRIRFDAKPVLRAVRQLRNMLFHGRETGRTDRMVVHLYCITMDFMELLGRKEVGETVRDEFHAYCMRMQSKRFVMMYFVILMVVMLFPLLHSTKLNFKSVEQTSTRPQSSSTTNTPSSIRRPNISVCTSRNRSACG